MEGANYMAPFNFKIRKVKSIMAKEKISTVGKKPEFNKAKFQEDRKGKKAKVGDK